MVAKRYSGVHEDNKTKTINKASTKNSPMIMLPN